MSRKLGLIAVGGIVIGAVCISTALTMTGGAIFNHMDFDFDPFDGPRCAVSNANEDGSRSLDWNEGVRVTIDIPANVHWQRGQGDKVVVTGDKALIGLVEIEDH